MKNVAAVLLVPLAGVALVATALPAQASWDSLTAPPVKAKFHPATKQNGPSCGGMTNVLRTWSFVSLRGAEAQLITHRSRDLRIEVVWKVPGRKWTAPKEALYEGNFSAQNKTVFTGHKAKRAGKYKARIRVVSENGLNDEGYTVGAWGPTQVVKVSKKQLTRVVSRSLLETRGC
jgi:hypothetical protein